ncbi:MAG: CHAT domain-containing protein, partial [Candidatus Thorarchaeota archaeon]
SDCFKKHRPRLIFLHACKGARSDSYEGFSGIALHLVYEGIPAVIAMRYLIENEEAIQFAIKFYESLSEGKDIDEAVQDGRDELGEYIGEGKENFSSRAFGSPAVYIQLRDSILENKFQKQPAPRKYAPVHSDIGTEPCPYPGCTNEVRRGSKRCMSCRRELTTCRDCGHVVASEIGICDFCDESIVQVTVKPSVLEETTSLDTDSMDRPPPHILGDD